MCVVLVPLACGWTYKKTITDVTIHHKVLLWDFPDKLMYVRIILYLYYSLIFIMLDVFIKFIIYKGLINATKIHSDQTYQVFIQVCFVYREIDPVNYKKVG